MPVFTRFHHRPETDTSAIERIQDCTSILDHATALRNEGVHGDREMRHAAHFPAVIVERYCNETGITFEEFLANDEHPLAMMRDPALAGFRVWNGRV